MTMPEPTTTRRLRRGLHADALNIMAEERSIGLTPLPVHLMLVTETATTERGHTACGGGLGQWISGKPAEVTCPGCLEWVHA